MKNIFFLLCAFATLCASAAEIRLQSEIDHVTVFQNRAQINAHVKTTLNQGVSNLVLENMSLSIDAQSLQVAGRGDFVIMGVKFNQNYLNQQKKSPQIQKIEDSLKITRNESENIGMLLKVAENEKLLLLANMKVGGEQTGLSLDKLKEISTYFSQRLIEIGMKQLKLESDNQKIKEKIQRLENQLNELNAKGNQPSGEVVITVSANARTNTELDLTYIVNGAGWSPIYDLRAKDSKSPVSLAYKANVWQNTGIDWNKVKLTLSTANPSEGGNKPELSAQFVSVYEPRVYQGAKKSVYMESVQQNDQIMAAPAAPMAGSTANFTTVQETTFAVNFDIALPYTILSGGNPELVDVQNYQLPVSFSHYATPKLDKDAFLVANVLGWEKYNLLSGKANIYFDGTFVGESVIEGSGVSDTLVVSLGRDKKIITKREKVADFSSRKTIGTNVKEVVAFKISVRNTKNEAVSVRLEDQYPISQDSRIEIELLESTGAEIEKETGKLTWNLELKPNESKEILLKYSVKYPKERKVLNL